MAPPIDWTTVIAAGIAVLGTAVGGLLGYFTARLQTRVQMRAIKEENKRLRAQHREAERQNRQGTYHRLLAAWDRLDMYATGHPPESDKQLEHAFEEVNFCVGGVELFGSPEVRKALRTVGERFEDLGSAMGHPDLEGPPQYKRFIEAYRPRRAEIIRAQRATVEAMRPDVELG